MKTIGLWLVAVGVGVCMGAPITLKAEVRGCVKPDGSLYCGDSGTASGNYLTGFVGNDVGTVPQNDEIRSFFGFDLTGIVGTVTTADFQLELPAAGYLSVDASETLGLFDILFQPSALTTSPLPPGGYADLGTGILYGSGVFDLSNEGTLVTIHLNAAAVAAINSSLGGGFAMGGAGISLARQTDQRELLFADSAGSRKSQLVLGFDAAPEPTAVPEPGTGLLLMAGLGVLVFRRGR